VAIVFRFAVSCECKRACKIIHTLWFLAAILLHHAWQGNSIKKHYKVLEDIDFQWGMLSNLCWCAALWSRKHRKFCHHLLSLMLFQICMTFIHLRKTNKDIFSTSNMVNGSSTMHAWCTRLKKFSSSYKTIMSPCKGPYTQRTITIKITITINTKFWHETLDGAGWLTQSHRHLHSVAHWFLLHQRPMRCS